MSTPTLEGGCVFASDDAAATVTAARTVADGGIDDDDPAAAAMSMSAYDAASSMLEKGKRNKIGTKDIGIQAFDAILQLGVGCRSMVLLLSCELWGPKTCLIHLRHGHSMF